MNRIVTAIVLAIAVLGCSVPAVAGDGSGHILVDVVDAGSGAPLTALVSLSGPLSTSDYGDAKGQTSFYAIPDGVYHARVVRGGYVTANSDAFEVAGDQTVTVRVRLVKKNVLKVIGSVSVRSEAVSSTSIEETSALRRVSETLPDALGKLGGVELAHDDSPGAAQFISLEGHSPSQTLATVDGLPLNVPGVASDLRQISSDLFTGAAVSFGPSAGSSAGSVNYRTLEPTLRWSTRVAGALSRFDSSFFSISEQGTSGKVGIALQHVSRQVVGGLDDSRYLDASGLDYTHGDVTAIRGDLAKFRYRLGAHDLVATVLTSSHDAALTCTQAVNAVPCGYGPGNVYSGNFALASVGDTFAFGSSSAQITLFHSTSQQNLDMSHRIVAGLAAPYDQKARTENTGATFSLQLAPGTRHAVTAQATLLSSQQHAAVSDQTLSVTSDVPNSYRALTLADRYRASPKWSFDLLAGWASTSQSPATASAGIHATGLPSADQSLTFNADITSAANPPRAVGTPPTPAGLAINCASQTATGFDPVDAGTQSATVTSLRAGWQRRIRSVRFNVQAYDEMLRGAVLNVLVNGTAYPDFASSGYVDAARAIYQSADYCGGAQPFDLQNLYFLTPLRTDTLRYTGARGFVSVPLGRRLVLQSSIDATSVRFTSSDPRVANGLSLSPSGRQMYGVAPLRGNVLLYATGATPGSLDLMANARYLGSNNAADLPAHWVVDAAIARSFQRGNATLLISNAFNAHAGFFSSPADALARTTVDGHSITGIARPNRPRSVTLTYRFATGPAQRRQTTQLAEAAKRQESAGGPPGFMLTRFPDHTPSDPFERNEGAACTDNLRKATDKIIAQLQPVVARLNAVGHVEETPPVPMPTLPGWDFRYSATAKAYTIALQTRYLDAGLALTSCVHLHVGSADEGKEHGVFVPTVIDLTQQKIFFSPTVGFYIIPIAPPPGFTQKFRTYALPPAPPAKPFRLAPDDVCIADIKPIATRLMGQLETYFATPNPDSGTTADWTITRHGQGQNSWYVLASNDTGALISMFSCGVVAAAAKSELEKQSLDGVPAPSFNYSPRVGLYTVKPEPKH